MAKKEWKVYFGGNFWGHEKGERRCREIVVEKNFTWEGQNWRVPSVYTCPRGVVIDFCVEVPAGEVRAFMEKWNLDGGERGDYTDEEYQQLDAENPLSFHAVPTVYVNGKKLQTDHGESVSWHPCLPDGVEEEPETREVLEHYACDPAQGWIFIRYAFRWTDPAADNACKESEFVPTERKRTRTPAIRDMKVILKENKTPVAGEHFCVECAENGGAVGEEQLFIHPVTGERHVLSVAALERAELPKSPVWHCEKENEEHGRWMESVEWPRKYIQMQYVLTPELTNQEISVVDCARSDQPRKRAGVNEGQASDDGSVRAAAVSVIGGADGPTSIFLGGKGEQNTHLACSAPRFEWAEQVEWRLIFYKKGRENKEVKIV